MKKIVNIICIMAILLVNGASSVTSKEGKRPDVSSKKIYYHNTKVSFIHFSCYELEEYCLNEEFQLYYSDGCYYYKRVGSIDKFNPFEERGGKLRKWLGKSKYTEICLLNPETFKAIVDYVEKNLNQNYDALGLADGKFAIKYESGDRMNYAEVNYASPEYEKLRPMDKFIQAKLIESGIDYERANNSPLYNWNEPSDK